MKSFAANIREAAEWARDAFGRISVRRESAPIADCATLYRFVHTRAALVVQKKLYGYVKERMGISYPQHFAEDAFATSLNIAKMQVFAAGLGDLTTHAVGQIYAATGIDRNDCMSVALECFREGLEANRAQIVDESQLADWQDAFRMRIEGLNWDNLAAGGQAFTTSAKALVRWAPIADQHKRHDREIVENSIRFAWNEVREDLRLRLDAAAVVSDYRARV